MSLSQPGLYASARGRRRVDILFTEFGVGTGFASGIRTYITNTLNLLKSVRRALTGEWDWTQAPSRPASQANDSKTPAPRAGLLGLAVMRGCNARRPPWVHICF